MTNFYETLPRKRMAAAAVFLDEAGQLLIVKPNYRPDWLLPGGTVEADESPALACCREVKEEIGLEIVVRRLLCVDYTARHDDVTEAVHFLYFGGVFSAASQQIVLQTAELTEYRFLPVEEALTLLNPRISKRIPYCLEAIAGNTVFYLEDGCPL